MKKNDFSSSRILIIDDQEDNVDVLLGFLEIKGYTNVIYTTDSRRSVSLFKSFSPDLILLDLMMPYIDGYEVMEQLQKQLPDGDYLPILVLTADITTEAKQRALSGGAKDFLAKPFDLVEVGLRIDNLLSTRFYHYQLQQQNEILEKKVKDRTSSLEKANYELNVANRDLVNLNQSKLHFLRLISHEIRTPLNGIKGFTDLLKSEIQSPELQEHLKCLEDSVYRLERFSYQALLITELRAGRRSLSISKVPFRELLDNASKLHLDKITGKQIRILSGVDPSLESLPADRELVQFCFDSILDNALNHTPAEGIINVNFRLEKESVVCEFIDSGDGFSTDALDHLYSYFMVGAQHTDQQTGLNLALVKLIMDAHGSTICIRNNESKGATICLQFKDTGAK